MASAVLRHAFHFALVTACQHFIGDVMADEGASWRQHLAHLLGAVEPVSPFEDATLRDALARLAVSAEHSPTFAGRRWIRDFSRAVAAIVGDPAVTAKAAYEHWQKAGGARGSTLDRTQLHSMVEQSRVEGRRLSALASEARLNPSTVRKAFRRAYGISPRELRARMQVIGIIERLRSSELKVGAVADTLGIRSPKNLYAALKTYTGLTPRQIRSLGPTEAAALCDRLRTGPAGTASATRETRGAPRVPPH